MSDSEWVSTNDWRYWRHRCGERVLIRNGLPELHTCTKKKQDNVYYTKSGIMSSYDRDGHCLECGSTVHGPQRNQHSNFHSNYIHRSEVQGGFAVSAVKWCDSGNHAFKASEPGAQSIDVMQRQEDGTEERVVMDMCSAHAFPTGQQTSPQMRQIESAYETEQRAKKDADAAYQRAFEQRMKDRMKEPMGYYDPAYAVQTPVEDESPTRTN